MTRVLNRRLSASDAAFLYTERPTQPMHIGSCNIYEGDLSRDDLLAVLRGRMHLLPRYRQRAVFPPFGVAHPTWEDDPDFDIANHVEEHHLPQPADDQVLSEVGGRVFGRLLDRRRPLWKLVLLRGLAGGRTAMIAMIHHALVDGVSGVELQMVLHDLTPDADPPAAPEKPWEPQTSTDPIALWEDAVRDRLTDLSRHWTALMFRWLRPGQWDERTKEFQSLARMTPRALAPMPPTPFNRPLSTARRFAWCELSFGDIRFIRSVFGGTINDVVLTVISGGLGRYLRAHGIGTDGIELRAMCPVSMRRPDQSGALGNLVSMMLAPLYVGLTDPAKRMAAERRAMEELKEQGQAQGLYALTEMADLTPPAWQAFALGTPAPQTLLNTVCTNVPGPQIPLYLGGRMLLAWYPLGPLASGIGLFNAILSYNQKLTIGATVDPNLVPDVWFYAACLRESFEELVDAAGAASGRGPAPAVTPHHAAPPAENGNGKATTATTRRRPPRRGAETREAVVTA